MTGFAIYGGIRVPKEYFDPEPLIVPPVLNKSDLVNQPLLRLLWTFAYNVLASAKRVVFIGYSMPLTDLAARWLFEESLVARTQTFSLWILLMGSAAKKYAIAFVR